MKVFATDHGSPPLVSSPLVLIVYVDPPTPVSLPVLSSVSFSVPENASIGSIVGYVDSAGFDSPGLFEYYIILGNTFGSFGVNYTSGALYVALPLSFTDCPSYAMTLQVHSSNPDTPPIYAIVVNVSVIAVVERVPVFDTELVFVAVRENVPIGSGVATMSATFDAKRGAVRYSIASQVPNGTSWLAIDAGSGYVTTAARIDRETSRQITATVSAIGEYPSGVSTATLVVVVNDVNDNAPVFENFNAVVNVSEDEALGYPVTTVVASDRDFGENGQVSYSVVAGNDYGHFQLDAFTGDQLICIIHLNNCYDGSW